MLADLVKTLVDLGRGERTVQVTKIEGRPNHVWMRKPDGTLDLVDLDKPIRKPTVRTLAALVAMIKDPSIAKDPEVYHGPDRIVGFLDRSDRREIVTLPLSLTARAAEIVALSQAPKAFDVRGLVRFLRVDMGCDTSVVAKFRTIDFKRSGSGKSTVDHGRETFGRGVEMSAQGVDELPDEIRVTTSMWQQDGVIGTLSVSLIVDIMLEQEKIGLLVSKDDLHDQRVVIDRAIANALRKELGDKIPVFNGNP